MSRVPSRHCALFLFLLGVAVPVAFGPAAFGQRYHVRRYSESDGMPSASVHGLAQTRDGSLWIGTRNGVVRYDGDAFRQPPSVRSVDLLDEALLATTRQGTLYAMRGGGTPGAARFRAELWHRLPVPPVGRGAESVLDFFGALESDGRDYLLASDISRRIVVFDGERWHEAGTLDGRDGPRLHGVAVDDGRFLLATSEGLLAFDPRDLADGGIVAALRRVEGSPDEPLVAVAVDRERVPARTWVVARTSVAWSDGESWTRRSVEIEPRVFGDGASTHAIAGPSGDLYFAGRWHLHHFHPVDGIERMGRASGLVADGTTAMLRDREGNVWVGDVRGLSKIMSLRFANYDGEHELLEDEVSAILLRRDGRILLGHNGGLSLIADPTKASGLQVEATLDIRSELGSSRVLDLVEDASGDVWIAASAAGLGRLPRDGGAIEWVDRPPDDGGEVTSVIDDPDRGIVFTTEHYPYRVERAGPERLLEPVVLRDASEDPIRIASYPRRLARAGDGALIIATSRDGILRIDGNRTRYLRASPDQAPENGVFALEPFEDGRVLAGTDRGLVTISGPNLVPHPDSFPGIDRPVYSILREPGGVWWFGTDRGVVRFNGSTRRQLFADHGLAGNELNRAAVLRDRQGDVWFGTDRGLSIYRERYEPPRGRAPVITLTELDVDGRIYSLDKPVTLSHGRSTIVIHFRVVSLRDEDRVRFRTMLEGFDEEWPAPEPLSARSVRYTNLPTGSYRFKIRAIDVEGNESPVAVSARIQVRAPFWRRTWFLAVALGAMLLLVAAGGSWVAQFRSARRLEAEVEERTAALRASRAAMADEKERLSVTLAGIVEAVVGTDARGEVSVWNPSAESLAGIRRDDALGRDLVEIARPACEPFASLVERVLASGEAADLEEPAVWRRNPSDDGSDAEEIEATGAPIRGPGTGTHGAVFVLRVVTVRRRMEKEMARTHKLEALGLLAGGLAHDFNNLLTGIVGGLSLVENRESLSDTGHHAVRGAVKAAERGQALTRQFLTFSRGGAPLRRTTSLEDVVRESASLVLSGSAVACDVDFAECRVALSVDPDQMSQVFENLLLNARQAMPDGGRVRVTGRAEKLDDGRTVLRIEVADDGPGIPAEQLERVFDPYFTTRADGNGLGLAVAHSVVRRHGGELTARSDAGGGTRFRIDLPIGPTPDGTGTAGADGNGRHETPVRRSSRQPNADEIGTSVGSAESEATRSATTARVLVLEDEPIVGEVIEGMLEQFGYRSVWVKDGRDAIESYSEACRTEDPFDAVLLDLTVPGGLGGRETLEHLRADDPDVRAIVISGYSEDAVLADFDAHGFRARLAKPFTSGELRAVLDRVIAG